MKNLSVVVKDNCRFINRLYSELACEFDVTLSDNKIVLLNVTDEEMLFLSDIIARNVIFEFQKKKLIGVVNKNCEFLTKSEKLDVWKKSVRQLTEDEFYSTAHYLKRLETVRKKVYECFTESVNFCVDGFLNFRLGEYLVQLSGVVDEALGEYLLEEEYREFISVLKYFVSVNPAKYKSVDVIYGKNVKIFFDGNDITDECRNRFYKDNMTAFCRKDDFLLDTLVILSPENIVVHIDECDINSELVETLNGVFGSRIMYRYDGNGIH